MALVRGFERTVTGALTTSSAAPGGTAKPYMGWARTSAFVAHRVNATVSLPAGSKMIRGRAYGPTGAVCFTTAAPSAANSKYINGIRHHINGAMYVKTTAPGATAIRGGFEKLLFDPADGAVFFDSTA